MLHVSTFQKGQNIFTIHCTVFYTDDCLIALLEYIMTHHRRLETVYLVNLQNETPLKIKN